MITPTEIRKAYKGLKAIARKHLKCGDMEKSFHYVNHCSVVAQQFNLIYADSELENIIGNIGKLIIPTIPTEYKTIEDRVVFIDDFCVTFVLGVQYIDALIAAGKKVLFLTCHPCDRKGNKTFFEYISRLPNVEIKKIKNGDLQKKITSLYDEITNYHPSKLFLHIAANSSITPLLYRLPKQITKYIINLADQTFWTGTNAIDYSLEFRPFGATVSLERRQLKKEQLLMLPFYPVNDGNSFTGFPEDYEDKVVIFSGGDLYKTLYHDKKYWQLLKQLLDAHTNVVFLFATKANPYGQGVINRFIKDNHFEGRFIYLGFRSDIYETFRHCDIYMGTSPVSGSLMSQLAAINAKPILQYYYPLIGQRIIK